MNTLSHISARSHKWITPQIAFLAVLLASYSWRWGFLALGLASLFMIALLLRWYPQGQAVRRDETGAAAPRGIASSLPFCRAG